MSTDDNLFETIKYRRRGHSCDYWVNDAEEVHRIGGPAVIQDNGAREWFLNGKRHREDGPAVEYSNGTKEWYYNGALHREDGPAAEWYNGAKGWYFNGFRIEGDALLLFDSADGRRRLAQAYGSPK